jgi:raffinose/stachyose/melibiose transport system permease protein
VARVLEASDAAYGRPPGTTSTFATVRQAMDDARPQLLTGKMTAPQFGAFMEAAAETERQNLAHPDRVVVRHPVAGTLLILVMVGLVACTLIQQVRRKRAVTSQSTAAPMNLRWALVFVGPAMLMYMAFVLAPSLEAFGWAFTRWDGIGEREGVGLLHFKRLLFQSDVFWMALRNNLFVMIVPTLFVVPLSLFFSFLISRGIWGSKVFRVCFFFPNILGVIAVTLLWMNAYNPSGGLVNAALVGVGFDSFEGFAWLSQDYLYWSLVPMIIWGTCGFNMILYLAAMESVDPALYEAATIDGAGSWQQFISITVPMIWEVLMISAVFMVMGGLKAFEQIWLLTNQAPKSDAHVIGTMMVSTMFQDFRIGQATAIAVMLFVLVFFGTLATMRLMKRETA